MDDNKKQKISPITEIILFIGCMLFLALTMMPEEYVENLFSLEGLRAFAISLFGELVMFLIALYYNLNNE